MVDSLHALTGLGSADPAIHQIGTCRIAERFDVALASLAVRKGRHKDVEKAAKSVGIPLPQPLLMASQAPYSAFWVAPEMWFIQAPILDHEDIAAHLKNAFGDAASITEQTDAWVVFELSGPNLNSLLERLCNVDFTARPDGFATRTVIDHLGCYLIKTEATAATLYGPRSSARSLFHALEVAAQSIA